MIKLFGKQIIACVMGLFWAKKGYFRFSFGKGFQSNGRIVFEDLNFWLKLPNRNKVGHFIIAGRGRLVGHQGSQLWPGPPVPRRLRLVSLPTREIYLFGGQGPVDQQRHVLWGERQRVQHWDDRHRGQRLAAVARCYQARIHRRTSCSTGTPTLNWPNYCMFSKMYGFSTLITCTKLIFYSKNLGESSHGPIRATTSWCFGADDYPFSITMGVSSCQGIEVTKKCPKRLETNFDEQLKVSD